MRQTARWTRRQLNPDIRERNVGAFDRKAQQRAVETTAGLAGVSNKERRGQIGAVRPIYFDDAVHSASPTAKRCLEPIFHREALEGNSLCVRTRPNLSISATVFILRIGAEKGRVSWKFTTSASCAAKRAPIGKTLNRRSSIPAVLLIQGSVGSPRAKGAIADRLFR